MTVIPMKTGVAAMIEDAARNARVDTANSAADFIQMYRPETVEATQDTIKLQHEISAAIRAKWGQFNPPVLVDGAA